MQSVERRTPVLSWMIARSSMSVTSPIGWAIGSRPDGPLPPSFVGAASLTVTTGGGAS